MQGDLAESAPYFCSIGEQAEAQDPADLPWQQHERPVQDELSARGASQERPGEQGGSGRTGGRGAQAERSRV